MVQGFIVSVTSRWRSVIRRRLTRYLTRSPTAKDRPLFECSTTSSETRFVYMLNSLPFRVLIYTPCLVCSVKWALYVFSMYFILCILLYFMYFILCILLYFMFFI